MKRFFLAWTMLLACSAISSAQEHGAVAATPGHEAEHAVDPAPHPTVPENPVWVRPVVTLIVAMFAIAWPVGAFIRSIMPEEIPPTHAHDEHHGHKDPHGDPTSVAHDTHGHDAHGHGH
jgi:hypothetical protein